MCRSSKVYVGPEQRKDAHWTLVDKRKKKKLKKRPGIVVSSSRDIGE